MRGVIKTLVLAGVLGLMWAPTQARADGFVSPWVGGQWSTGDRPDSGRGAFGVTAGAMGAGIIGGEVDFGLAPSFWGNKTTFGTNSMFNLMGNLIVGVPIGGTSGAGIRPFATVGLGLLHSQIDNGNILFPGSHTNDLGWDAGVGVLGYFSNHVGLRGDLRYFRNTNIVSDAFDPLRDAHWWRASIGVSFR